MAHIPALTAIFDASMDFLRPTSANATSVQELEAVIGSLLSTVHRAVAETASAWNARTDRVWRRLPVELRAECFQHLPLGDKVALSHTSRLWRLNAVNTPELWTTIRCTDVSPRQTARVHELLRRSGNASLALTVTPQIKDNAELFAQLKAHIHCLRSLAVVGSGDATTFMEALLSPAQFPLARMEMLHLSDETYWSAIPTDLSRLLPRLRSLHVNGNFPGIFHPMPQLRSLRFTSSEVTDSRQLFDHCPNLALLAISGHIYPSRLPHTRPPASLRNVALSDEVYGGPGVLDLSSFLAPWAGHKGLESLRLVGVRELASAVALFASLCAGPWMMRIRGAHLDGWLNIVMAAVGEHNPYFQVSLAVADVGAATDVVRACLPFVDNLDLLELPVCIFERLFLNEDVSVSFPAVTNLRISTVRSGTGTGVEADNARALNNVRLTDWVGVPATRVLRTPRLQSVTLLTDEDSLSEAIAFAGTLRRTIKFDATRLDRVIFSGAFARHELFDLMQGLRRLTDNEVAREVGYLCSLDFVRIVP